MHEILAELIRLDDAGLYQGIVDHLARTSIHPALFAAGITHLMKNHRLIGACHLGSAMVRLGFDDPAAHLANAIAASIANRPDLAERTASLGRVFEAMAPEQQPGFVVERVTPALMQLVFALQNNDPPALLRSLEILKAVSPRMRAIFDGEPDVGPSAGSHDQAPLVRYRGPPEGAPRVPYRVVVAMREKILYNMPGSRLLDIGPRFVDAATRYGWIARFCPMSYTDIAADLLATFQHCQAFAADVLILDDHLIMQDGARTLRGQMVAALRRLRPSLKIVSLHLDSWRISPDVLIGSMAESDAIWATTPSMPHWQDPVFEGKLLLAPLVHAGHSHPPDEGAPNRISFVGSLTGFNWHRLFWRASALQDGLPIDWQESLHMVDGLSPLDSYADYIARLRASGCALNLSMRPDLCCVITDRSFEAPLAGALLIQEHAPDMDHFFVAGTHYLSFGNYAGLREVAQMVASEPERVQEVRRAGHAFAVERYADDKLMGYLDAILFHPVR